MPKWKLRRGTGFLFWTRDLAHVANHYAVVLMSGDWNIYERNGNRSQETGKGSEKNVITAKRAVDSWDNARR